MLPDVSFPQQFTLAPFESDNGTILGCVALRCLPVGGFHDDRSLGAFLKARYANDSVLGDRAPCMRTE